MEELPSNDHSYAVFAVTKTQWHGIRRNLARFVLGASAAAFAIGMCACLFSKQPVRIALVRTDRLSNEQDQLLAILRCDERVQCDLISVRELQAPSSLYGVNVVVFPGGSAAEYAEELGEHGRQNVREFVRRGGGYLGICAGAFLAVSDDYRRLGLLNANIVRIGDVVVNNWGPVKGRIRSGIASIGLTNTGKRVFGHHADECEMYYSGGPLFRLDENNESRLGDEETPVVLGRYKSVAPQVGDLAERVIDTPAALLTRFGKGSVIAMGPHPEMVPGSEPLLIECVLSIAKGSYHGQ